MNIGVEIKLKIAENINFITRKGKCQDEFRL